MNAPTEPSPATRTLRLVSRRRWEYSSVRNSSVSEMLTLESDPIPNRPPAVA